jgi:hypothetical protein
MDMLSNSKLSPPSKTNQWPNTRAKKGLFYGVKDPVFGQDNLVVMLDSTWTEVGTIIEHQKRTMAMQDKAVKELKAANGALAAQLNDAHERMENLRAAYREMKRAQLVKENPDLGAAEQTEFVDGKPLPSFL